MSTSAKKSVAIYGGGIAGAVLAHRLSRDFDVVLVDPHDYFEVPMAVPRNLVQPDFAEAAIVPFAHAMPSVRHEQAKLVKMTRDGGIIAYGDGRHTRITADASVLATGTRFPNQLMRPDEGSAARRKKFYRDYNARLGLAQRVLIVGGGPIGVETAGEISEVFPNKSVTILESGNRLLMGTSPEAAAHAASVLAARGVDIVIGERLEGSERPTDDLFGDGGEAVTSSGRVIPYDLMIWCTGGRPDTAYMADDFPEVLDTDRRIMVTPGLMVVGQQKLFAMGDVTNLPENKMALHTKGHVKVVETNIRRLLQGSPSAPTAAYAPKTENPMMAVTLGSRTGVSHVPLLGVVRSAWLNRKVKAERMLVPQYRKALGV
jgi:NADH dehydrogenase FAD-containing subunit